MYKEILKTIIDSGKILAKIDLKTLNEKLVESKRKPIAVLTLYYGLKNVLDDDPHKAEYELKIRRHDNQVWIQKK
jgi:hypothetical protein